MAKTFQELSLDELLASGGNWDTKEDYQREQEMARRLRILDKWEKRAGPNGPRDYELGFDRAQADVRQLLDGKDG